MKKRYLYIFIIMLSAGCSNSSSMNDYIDHEDGWVKIYSTTDMRAAQDKAEALCGKKAYYLEKQHVIQVGLEKKSLYPIPVYIPFQCEMYAAARAGNTEAREQVKIENEKGLERLKEAKKRQYEAHKAYAKKYGSDSYSLVNPDGSIEAYSFDTDGNVCGGTADQNGSHTYCD